jgi:DNA mismatch repair protein MutS2
MTRDIHTELDLRGKLCDEALMEMEKFLDDAALSGITSVTIIHGKGTGALRSAVQQALRGHPHIRSFRLGVYGEGESGVTIAELN